MRGEGGRGLLDGGKSSVARRRREERKVIPGIQQQDLNERRTHFAVQ